jgi:hypothetical protein
MRLFSAVLFTLVAAGCASTTIQDTWKDPAFNGPKFQQVLVFGVSRSDSTRRIFEDGFVSALQGAGAKGAPAYPVLPKVGPITNGELAQAIAQTQSDCVLVTRLLRVEKDVNVSPGYVSPGFYGRGFGGWYGGAWGVEPNVRVNDVLTLESTLWDARVDKPVWSGTTEVYAPKDVAKETAELAKVLVGKLKADGLL